MAFAANGIPFSQFASLIEALSKVKPRRVGQKRRSTDDDDGTSPHLKHVASWISHYKQLFPGGEGGGDGNDVRLPEGTVRIFLRLFFPEEGARRRFGMQETILCQHLSALFRIDKRRFENWNAPSLGQRAETSGCLGTEVGNWMERKGRGLRSSGAAGLTLGRVDQLLDEFAANCDFSAKDVRLSPFLAHPRRTNRAILRDLITPLSAFETSLMIQLILRDLSPLLYAPPSSSGHIAITEYNTAAYKRLEVWQVLRAWHPAGDAHYRVVKDLDYVGKILEDLLRDGGAPPEPLPVFGVPVQIPKANRPGTCAVACQHLRGRVAVETKYDGERLQIHVDLSRPLHDQIRIFSKSTRESTVERRGLLPIIRAALGLPPSPYDTFDPLLLSRLASLPGSRSTSHASRFILEGEMVPYDEEKGAIQEFWTLGTGETMSQERQGQGRRWVESSLHLKIVWFDLLAVEDESLLDLPFEERRARLASVVREILGYSMLVDSVDMDFSDGAALSDLRLRFAHIITSRCEGLMLKPLASRYNDWRSDMRWVKLKKDFIPGAGDTLDFHVIGASWNKKRGRELLLPTSMYTTFFIGLRADHFGARFSKFDKPHFHVLFSTSYGLDREQLGQLDAYIRARDPLRFEFTGTTFQECDRPKGSYQVYESPCCTFTFSLAGNLTAANSRPRIIFKEPTVFELNGAGFQRSGGSSHYELRWPRITKMNRVDGEPLSLSALQKTAVEAMRVVSADGSQNLVQLLWSRASTKVAPPETDQQRYDRELRDWVLRLEKADKVGTRESLLRELPTLVEPPPTPRALAHVTNLRVEAKGKARESPPLVEEEPFKSSLRIEETFVHFDIDLTSSPTTSSGRLASPSSPRRPTNLPALAPSSPPTSFKSTHALSSPIHKRLLKRPRASCPSILSSPRSISPLLSTDNPPSPNKRTRHRYTLSSFSSLSILTRLTSMASSSPNSSSAAPPNPYDGYAWSFGLSPALGDSVPTPRQPFLEAENYFVNPLDVLWGAGWLPTDRSVAYERPRRTGYIFVEGGQADVDVLKEKRGRMVQGKGPAMTVWIVDKSACASLGDWDGEGVLSVF